jgi:hypothetical protein
MVDDGDENLGDEVAGDGIYSFKNIFAETAQVGVWKFEYSAVDKSGLKSNTIMHNLYLQR